MSKPIANIPGIPEPRPDPVALMNTVSPIKQGLEELSGQRGPQDTTAVTWGDLVALGLIARDRMPR
jgi:hypothetical protein